MPKKGRYEALNGINYVPDGKDEEVRREIGDRFDDLPERAQWMLKPDPPDFPQGHVLDHEAVA